MRALHIKQHKIDINLQSLKKKKKNLAINAYQEVTYYMFLGRLLYQDEESAADWNL